MFTANRDSEIHGVPRLGTLGAGESNCSQVQGDGNVQRLILVTASPLPEYTKIHEAAHFSG